MRLEDVTAYEILEQKEIKELNSTGIILKHKKSGARVFLLSNDDENKVFTIGFRTPSADSTGTAHILEHSVLCGSEKFPAKDPFVELVKGSLNTFLNAMTYPDKTLYPVASCNEKDFQNLMDVYMDAVFHPNIYKERKIFEQEGWHYELQSKDEPLTLNGVVYNEMKGEFSSPESVLDRVTRTVLFPDTSYRFESGGDPDVIPTLEYETFLEFHRTYYHPSNSYIYLYGNMDMAEKLAWLDEEYLSSYEEKQVDSALVMQKPFEKPVEKEIFYSITEDEESGEEGYLSINTVVGTDVDPKLYVGFQILEYALINAPGAPLKQALLDAGIGQDIFGGYENGILQPYFSVIAKGAGKAKKAEFVNIIKETLNSLAENGINKKSLLAGINYYEFRYREADYGSFPKGLMYGLQCFDSWLYDAEPLMHLAYQDTFDFMKERVEEGYFEQLIRDYLIGNPHEAVLVATPQKNLTARKDRELEQNLADRKAQMDDAMLKACIRETKSLKEYQAEPTPKEILEKIPLLNREDISREPAKFYIEEKQVGGVTALHHEMFTSGIGYLKLLFDTCRIPAEQLPYVGLLKSVLGYVNTKNYSYSDLFSEIHMNTGGISLGINTYADMENKGEFFGMFEVSARVLYENLGFGFRMIEEMLWNSILEDEKRLKEIIGELKAKGQTKLMEASHSAAVGRAMSYFSPMSYYSDQIGGISYYQFIEDLDQHFEERKEGLIAGLKSVIGQLFAKENLLVSYTADQDGFALLEQPLAHFAGMLSHNSNPVLKRDFPLVKKNEGFKTSAQVNYVARVGTFAGSGYSYTGALNILKVIMSYDYLWINIRVKGGAYGCMAAFGRTGDSYLVSYRDPNLGETNSIYDGIPEYLENFDADERDMTKYVIGTISDMDTPMNPAAKGARSLAAYISKVSYEVLKKERMEVLNATTQDIRNLAGIVKAVLDTGCLCVIGNEEKIEKNRPLFGEVKNLFHSER